MKKKILVIAVVAMAASASMWSSKNSKGTGLNDLALSNIEALAEGEGSGGGGDFGPFFAYNGREDFEGTWVRVKDGNGVCMYRQLIDIVPNGFCGSSYN
ncbi:NVEALA domain-containing protein [Parabacteroides bouchesdurhonensis]|uniref:NVEALA domain-containing protein n=1 Tax=Parabacteroides bouchesdurhonensis TaxID=1936995 RepID=UPI000C81B4F3|nr:NVEALA domain-containing protein [Parabacteroides bouchesdurhonensis]